MAELEKKQITSQTHITLQVRHISSTFKPFPSKIMSSNIFKVNVENEMP
jgi:hypothetical protein